MGNEWFRYRLYGKHERISEGFGWLRIDRVEDLHQSPTEIVHAEALLIEVIYEYIKVPRSSFPRHPANMLWLAGRWNAYFDLILFTNNFVMESFDSLKLAIEQGTLEEIYPSEMLKHINDALIKHFEILFIDFDKTKFMKIGG